MADVELEELLAQVDADADAELEELLAQADVGLEESLAQLEVDPDILNRDIQKLVDSAKHDWELQNTSGVSLSSDELNIRAKRLVKALMLQVEYNLFVARKHRPRSNR